MQYRHLAFIAVLACAGAARGADSPPAEASWQVHNEKFLYSGWTTYYTCDGLAAKVREILLILGADKDASVTASGCFGSGGSPTAQIWISARFRTVTAVKADKPTDAVRAEWATVQLAPRKPLSMGEGECEIVEQMQKLITGSFTLRNLDYQARCIPHQGGMSAYAVRGQVLRMAASPKQ
jgi:hypothetical protein